MEEFRTNEHMESTPLINTEPLAAELDKDNEENTQQTDMGGFNPSSGDRFAVPNALFNLRMDLEAVASTIDLIISDLEHLNLPLTAITALHGVFRNLHRLGEEVKTIEDLATTEARTQTGGGVETNLIPLKPGSLSPITSMEDWVARHCGNVALFEKISLDLWDHLPDAGPLTDAVFALRESFSEQAETLKKIVNNQRVVQ